MTKRKKNMGRLDVFRDLLRKEKPQMKTTSNNELDYAALQAEIEQCATILKDYEAKISEGLQHANEIRNHITELQIEQIKILTNIPELQGAPK